MRRESAVAANSAVRQRSCSRADLEGGARRHQRARAASGSISNMHVSWRVQGHDSMSVHALNTNGSLEGGARRHQHSREPHCVHDCVFAHALTRPISKAARGMASARAQRMRSMCVTLCPRVVSAGLALRASLRHPSRRPLRRSAPRCWLALVTPAASLALAGERPAAPPLREGTRGRRSRCLDPRRLPSRAKRAASPRGGVALRTPITHVGRKVGTVTTAHARRIGIACRFPTCTRREADESKAARGATSARARRIASTTLLRPSTPTRAEHSKAARGATSARASRIASTTVCSRTR